MNSSIDRRSVLKLLSLLPVVPLLAEQSQAPDQVSSPSQNQQAPNVLILIFDTLAAGHTTLYGYRRDTAPNLARFAQRSTVYHSYYSAGNYTTPGTASLLTGLYPWTHRAFHPLGTVAENCQKKNIFHLFAAAGYETIVYTHNALVNVLFHHFRQDISHFKKMGDLCLQGPPFAEQLFSNDFSVALHSEWLTLRDGDRQHMPGSLFISLVDKAIRGYPVVHVPDKEGTDAFPKGVQSNFHPLARSFFFVLEDAIDWMISDLSSFRQPFLAYIHLYPPHEPYHPRREFIDRFEDGWMPPAKPPHFFSEGHSDEWLNDARQHYDEYIAYTDAEFGRLYDAMERGGLLDNTYMVVTSDHGQMFERGIHGHWTEAMHEPLLHIPLLISSPGQRQRQDVFEHTNCVDLLPTLLQATGQAIPAWCEGAILPAFGGSEINNQRSTFAVEAKSNPKQAPLTKSSVVLCKDRYKLSHYFGYPGYESEYELYDLLNDPEEMENLYQTKTAVAAELQNELADKLKEVNEPLL